MILTTAQRFSSTPKLSRRGRWEASIPRNAVMRPRSAAAVRSAPLSSPYYPTRNCMSWSARGASARSIASAKAQSTLASVRRKMQ